MKKLRSKQKLISGIAIILVAIILAVVITTNIIKNNSQVASEGYSTTTANANSNLVASYIKKGITLGGITGTLESLNTFDATALPEDILWGETAYVKGEKITGTKIVTVAHAKDAQKTFEENTILVDDYGNSVKIPAGFKIAEDSATSVTGGVVIEDVSAEGTTEYTKGSQFVWVPVGDVITDNNENKTTITLGRYTFNTSTGKENLVQSAENWSDTSNNVLILSKYKELATSTLGNTTAKNLENFVTNTMSSGGYYIGRYELGDALANDTARTSSSNDSNPVSCKAGIYPFTYTTQMQSASLCRNMYKSSNFESDLINSYAWDTAIVFILKCEDIKYSIQTVLQKTLAKCGEATDGVNKDVRCNIYDMAGNTSEYNTETDVQVGGTPYPCGVRGSSIVFPDSKNGSSSRGNVTLQGTSYGSDVTYGNASRPILYLNF